MGGSFCAFSARYVRLGNYEVSPRGKVLTTETLIQMRVPHTGNKDDFVTVEISMEDVLNVLVHFGPQLPALFLYINPRGCKKIREVLNMDNILSHYLDVHNCQDNSQKRISIVLDNAFGDDDKEFINKQFGGRLHEIELQNAENILLLSSPKTNIDNTNSFPYVLNAKRSFKTGDVILTWKKINDNFTNTIIYSNLEVTNNPDGDDWKTFKRTKICQDSVLPSVAKYDQLRPGQTGYFRAWFEDDSLNKIYSNVSTVVF